MEELELDVQNEDVECAFNKIIEGRSFYGEECNMFHEDGYDCLRVYAAPRTGYSLFLSIKVIPDGYLVDASLTFDYSTVSGKKDRFKWVGEYAGLDGLVDDIVDTKNYDSHEYS
jgi:hypothetical protein